MFIQPSLIFLPADGSHVFTLILQLPCTVSFSISNLYLIPFLALPLFLYSVYENPYGQSTCHCVLSLLRGYRRVKMLNDSGLINYLLYTNLLIRRPHSKNIYCRTDLSKDTFHIAARLLHMNWT